MVVLSASKTEKASEGRRRVRHWAAKLESTMYGVTI